MKPTRKELLRENNALRSQLYEIRDRVDDLLDDGDIEDDSSGDSDNDGD